MLAFTPSLEGIILTNEGILGENSNRATHYSAVQYSIVMSSEGGIENGNCARSGTDTRTPPRHTWLISALKRTLVDFTNPA